MSTTSGLEGPGGETRRLPTGLEFHDGQRLDVKLTCDLADGHVVTDTTLRVPGHALDTIGSSGLKVVKSDLGVGGVHFIANVGTFSDDHQRIKDGVLHWSPDSKNALIGG